MITARFSLRDVVCLATGLLATAMTPHIAIAHQTPVAWPTEDELQRVQPAVGQSIPVARKIVTHFRHRLSASQLHQLDHVRHHLEMMSRVDAGYLGSDQQKTTISKARLVDYYRWRTEQALFEVLNQLTSPDVIELDFRNGLPSRSPDARIMVDGQDDMLLLRVRRGESSRGNTVSPDHLTVATWDLASERPQSHFAIDIADTGVTYALIDLRRLPDDQTISHLRFVDKATGDDLQTFALTLRAAPKGHLAIDVVDQNGQSIPVLMSLATEEGGRLWEPAEAVDLTTVFNDIVPHLSSSGRGYMFYLPGKRRGRYWVVRPPIEMTLPAGRWDIKVLRGLEFTPIKKTVAVVPHEWTRTTLQPKRWTDMNRRGWYSGDDHVHAQLINSEDARKLMDYTRAVDINVANVLEMGDVMRTYYPQRGFGKDFQVRDQNHWLVPGQEDPRSVLGHAIGLNLSSKVRDLDRYLSNEWIAEQIHQQGGLYGHTHVGANACFVHRQMALFTPFGIVDFNSIMQAQLGTELYYDFLNLGFKMTATAGADTPYGGTIGAVRTYAYTGDTEECSPDAWFAAIKRGRTFVTNGPMLDFRVQAALPNGEDALPGDEICSDRNRRLQVTAKAWGAEGAAAPARLRLIKLGEVEREAVANEPNAGSLNLDVEIEVGRGCWIAAHAVSHDGAEAHTTPIYLTREGYRHWDRDKAGALLEKQLNVLEEIEFEISKSERLIRSGAGLLDYWNRRSADQAEAVRKNVSAARNEYRRLKQLLGNE
ncbi:CehA/McbA family metallohydrolase [Roseiconus lacunae]|uniref:CehA/McbA family metallohydrolase n=1 Tax=Roseiconus lacunae TaxID=2605694 RepID=UPI00308D3E8C|nr:CehA/McbA family metallohydrolase [Stieleria sp. HD01]